MDCLWFWPVLLLFSSVQSTEVIVVNDEAKYLRYPGDFNCELPIEWVINVAEEGSGVAVFVNETFLNPDNEEHLVLSPDSTMSGENSSVVYLTGNLTNIALAIPLVNQSFLHFGHRNECSSDLKFTLMLTQYEEKTPIPPPRPPNPYPPTGFKTEILVYLEGKTIWEFEEEDFQNSFKAEIQKIAFKFSEDNDLKYNPLKSSNETVFLRGAKTCPEKWEGYETCVSVWIAVYVTDPNTKYELTVAHLQQLWDKVRENGLPTYLNIKPYVSSDVSLEILEWLSYVFIALCIAFVVGYFLWKLERNSTDIEMLLKEEKEKQRKEIFKDVELRNKKPQQLNLSKHQKLPDFMMGNADAVSAISTPPATKKHVFRPILKVPTSVDGPTTITNINGTPMESPTSPTMFNGLRPMFFNRNPESDETDQVSQL